MVSNRYKIQGRFVDMESAFFVNSAHLRHGFFDENGLLLLLLYHIFEKSKEVL